MYLWKTESGETEKPDVFLSSLTNVVAQFTRLRKND